MITANKMYYVSAVPWKGSPFKCALVVLTSKGEEEVKSIWRKFYGNDSLEPEELTEVPFQKGHVEEEADA